MFIPVSMKHLLPRASTRSQHSFRSFLGLEVYSSHGELVDQLGLWRCKSVERQLLHLQCHHAWRGGCDPRLVSSASRLRLGLCPQINYLHQPYSRALRFSYR